MNFALKGFQDFEDVSRVVKISNDIVKKIETGKMNECDTLDISSSTGRKYKAGIQIKNNLIVIERTT